MSEPARRPRILVVDASRYHQELARRVLSDAAELICCAEPGEALAALGRGSFDVVLADLALAGAGGGELLDRVRREHPATDVAVVTPGADPDGALQALRQGAHDFLQKPLRAEDLSLVVQRILARRALAEENARLREERAILESCKSLTPCLEPEDVYAVALDLVLRALARRRGMVLYHRISIPTSDGFQFRGFEEDQESCLRLVLGQRKPLDLSGFAQIARIERGPVHDALREAGIEPGQLLVLPVRGQETEIGLFLVLDEGRSFDDREIDHAALVVSHTSISLRNAERYHRARERAFVDDVTEAYNARYLLEAMEREIRRAERYGGELSILFLDLDRFKTVNDRHGHLVGSRTLRHLARLLAQCVRQVDTLARYGGDEFTIILVDSGERLGLEVAERIRRSVEAHPFETGSGEAMHLTLSVGVSTYPLHGRTREALLEAADQAMYRAKSKGRNRVCSASELG